VAATAAVSAGDSEGALAPSPYPEVPLEHVEQLRNMVASSQEGRQLLLGDEETGGRV
jgi:hypothetical protein